MELHSCFQYSKQNVQEGIQWFYYRGAQHYPGESSFFGRGGGGGGPNPLSPYGSAHKHRGSNTDRNRSLNMGTD